MFSKGQTEKIDARKFIELEEELLSLKQQYHIEDEPKWWQKAGDVIAEKLDREPVLVNRKKYIKMATFCGWFCGAHRFYTKQPVMGVLYLVFCWSGVPFAMTLIDLMIALPKKADEDGNILL